MRESTPATGASRGFVLALALALPLSACDLLSPAPDLEVALRAESVDWWAATEGLYQRLECTVTIGATVTGDAEARGRWESGAIEVFVGADGETPVTTLNLTADQVAQAFGSQEFGPGDDPRLLLDLNGTLPFFGRLQQTYAVAGSGPKAAEARFECGTGGEVGAPPGDLFLPVPDTFPEPGMAMTLGVSARADLGVWAMNVAFSGAWTATVPVYLHDQIGQGSVTDSVVVHVPWDTPQGATLEARLIVTDMAGQVTRGAPVDLGPVTDLSPPRIIYLDQAADSVAVGDTALFSGRSQDASPYWVVYSAGEPEVLRDSVRVEVPGEQSFRVRFQIQPGWEGSLPVTLWAVDSLGQRSDSSYERGLGVYPSMTAAADGFTAPGPVTDIRIGPVRLTSP